MYLFLLAVACQHNLKFWKWKKYIYVTELPTDKNSGPFLPQHKQVDFNIPAGDSGF